MLFGTFQEIPYDNLEELKKDSNAKPHIVLPWEAPRREIQGTGEYKMWAFPIDDLSSAVTHALFTAPNVPDIFYIIDTDDYLRINKIKHYQNILNGKEDAAKCIDEKAENKYSEFLLKPEELKKANRFVITANILSFIAGGSIHEIFGDGTYITQETQTFIREEVKKIPLMEAGRSDKYSEKEREIFIHSSRSFYVNFVLGVMPMLIKIAMEGKAEALWIESGVVNWKKLLIMHNKFTAWSYEDCSIEEYNMLFDETRKYVLDEEWLIVDLLENTLPRPNDKCPCGSGKKFKKCHGRYI